MCVFICTIRGRKKEKEKKGHEFGFATAAAHYSLANAKQSKAKQRKRQVGRISTVQTPNPAPLLIFFGKCWSAHQHPTSHLMYDISI